MWSLLIVISVFCGTFSTDLDENDLCSTDGQKCNFGLKCEGRCIEDPNAPACFKNHLNARRLLRKHIIGIFLPNCEANGDFNLIQYVGSMCYCADKAGMEIPGYMSPMSHLKNKNCRCARDQYEYSKKHFLGRNFSCDELGNYKPIQCFGSSCFCVDSYGKWIKSIPPVFISDMKKLKCNTTE